MSAQRACANTWVVVEVRGQEFAVPAANVREILGMPDITAVPLCRPQDRGVIILRGPNHTPHRHAQAVRLAIGTGGIG